VRRVFIDSVFLQLFPEISDEFSLRIIARLRMGAPVRGEGRQHIDRTIKAGRCHSLISIHLLTIISCAVLVTSDKSSQPLSVTSTMSLFCTPKPKPVS
jgi:hypothetical protein